MAKEKKPILKKWSIWYEPYIDECYVVLKVYGNKITIQWLSDGLEYTGLKSDCSEDQFIRMLTPLEKELL